MPEMRRPLTIAIVVLLGALLLVGCTKTTSGGVAIAEDLLSGMAGADNISAEKDQTQQDSFSSEEPALIAYSEFLSGNRTLLDEAQSEMWEIPDFQGAEMKYEYTYLDLDGDGVHELLVQLEDDPHGYNAVFHFENGQIFCWNSDMVESSCCDYPLNNSTMVRQYDFSGTRSYTIFRYKEGGEEENISQLFAREELIPEDSSEPCPYYEIDGKEVDKVEFDKQLDLLVTGRLVERAEWTEI